MSATDHASIHGSPGEGARMAGIARAIWPLLIVLFVCGYIVGTMVQWPHYASIDGGMLLTLAFLLAAYAHFCSKRVESFFKGAAGEEIVARELARLPAGYHVFQSLDSGGGVLMRRGGDIDHVVVGPTGVFAIETKNWRGRVSVADGKLLVEGVEPRRAPLAQAQQAVSKLQVRLGRGGIYHAQVVPVVCFASECFEIDPQTVGEAVVCNASSLLGLLLDEKRQGTLRADVSAIVQVLESSHV